MVIFYLSLCMSKLPHNYILIPLDVATNQLARLKQQLNAHNGTLYSKGILQGLIEAYMAILMQPTVYLPDKKVL